MGCGRCSDACPVDLGAIEIVKQLTPSIVIPMFYSDSAEVKKFCEEMEVESPKAVPEVVEKLKLKSRADLPEKTEVVLMSV